MAIIKLLLTADDKASPVMKKLGDSAKRLGAGMAAAGAVAGAAAIAFGIDSVKAYAESEQAQAKLSDAFARFPKLADTNLTSLQKLNSELAKKTRFDDDATAAAQATLAQYELTGKQLEQLTPLLQDYAAKTGKDLPSAAEDLGKAMLGQGRALKDVGIDFQDTGTLAGNFDQIMQGLSEKVGGFAAVDAETASGKLEILKNRFGEVQEKVGGALMGALDGLVEWLNGDGMVVIEGLGVWLEEEAIPGFQDLVAWVIEYKDILGPAALALGTLTGAQWLLNAAMAANPVGLVIAGLAAIIALGTLIVLNWNEVTKVVYRSTGWVLKGLLGLAYGAASGIQSVINALLGGISRAASLINPFLRLIGLPTINLPSSVNFTDALANKMASFGSMLDYASNNGIEGLNSYLSSGGSGGGGGGGKLTAMAEGGAVTSATIALIGEGSEPEGVVPLSKFPDMVKAAGYGGDGSGGVTLNIHLHGVTTTSEAELGRVFVKAVRAAQDTGMIRKVLPNA